MFNSGNNDAQVGQFDELFSGPRLWGFILATGGAACNAPRSPTLKYSLFLAHHQQKQHTRNNCSNLLLKISNNSLEETQVKFTCCGNVQMHCTGCCYFGRKRTFWMLVRLTLSGSFAGGTASWPLLVADLLRRFLSSLFTRPSCVARSPYSLLSCLVSRLASSQRHLPLASLTKCSQLASSAQPPLTAI